MVPKMRSLPPPDKMYQALIDRNSEYDGQFYVGVRTTGIFCRTVCTAKKPKRENVTFFGSTSDALHAGFRPCKICRPMDPSGKPAEWVASLFESIDAAPERRWRDRDLRAIDLDPARVRRYFVKQYGMTFQAFSRARRLGVALQQIRNGQGLTETAMDIGYESDSGFRDAFEKVLGQTPGRANAANIMLAKWIESPLGALLAMANDDGLCLLEFVNRRMLPTQIQVLQRRFDARIVPGDNDHLQSIASELVQYFAGNLQIFSTTVVLRGTEFQERVWRHLMTIPYGKTESYGEMAAAIGSPDGQRAVGKANGDNRLSIIVPCHRVIKSDGTLCGYGGGLWRKKWLLELEGQSQQPSLEL